MHQKANHVTGKIVETAKKKHKINNFDSLEIERLREKAKLQFKLHDLPVRLYCSNQPYYNIAL